MPYDKPEADDPFAFVGVGVHCDAEAVTDMAYTFAEEFARLGHSEEQIFALFRNPFYRGAHDTYSTLGAEEIQRIVRECVGVWGRTRCVIRDTKE